jgi:hypothetical protein
MNAQVVDVTDMTAKWELAQRISGHAKAPEDAIRSIFTGIMISLEDHAKKTFEPSMKDRVWNKVSKENLKTIKDFFITEFCDKILGRFKENEVEEMLKEHIRTGFVRNPLYSSHIQTAYHFNQTSIIDSICKKAEEMATGWVPEIIQALKEEGVAFPELIQQQGLTIVAPK